MGSCAELDLTLSPERHDSLESYASIAQDAEALGFDTASFGETTAWDAITLLTILADRTNSIHVASDAIGPFSRSPGQIAQGAASVQSLADGRLRLGLGTSSPAIVEGWHGLAFDRPLRRLRETIDIVNFALAGEDVTYDGEIFSPDGFELGIDDVRPVPIDVAALGPKAVELAGRFADGWTPQLLSPEGLRERQESLRRGAELGNRDPGSIRTSLLLRGCALEDGQRARRMGRRHLAFMIAVYGPFYRESIANQGYQATVETIRACWRKGKRNEAFAAIDDDMLDRFVATGTPERVTDIVETFRDIDGCDAVRFGWLLPVEDPHVESTMRAIAPGT